MYHHTVVVMIGEDERLGVEVVPDKTGVLIQAQSDLTLRIEWVHVADLVGDLMGVMPPEAGAAGGRAPS